MVIAVQQLEVCNPRPVKAACSARTNHRVARCLLPLGHPGHHETQVRTRRVSGVVVGYRYAWLESTSPAGNDAAKPETADVAAAELRGSV